MADSEGVTFPKTLVTRDTIDTQLKVSLSSLTGHYYP